MARTAWILVGVSSALLIALLIPLFFLGLASSLFKTQGEFQAIGLGVTIFNTLEYALLGSLFSVALSFVYAWLVSRTDLPFKRFFSVMVLVSFILPALVRAIVYGFLLNRNGLLNVIYNIVFHTNGGFFNIYSMAGMIFIWSFGSLAVPYLIFKPALDTFDPSLEESARVAGAKQLLSMRRIIGPLLLPAFAASFLLSVVGVLNVFDYPYIIGSAAGIKTLMTEIYFLTTQSLPPDYADAIYFSLVYIAITGAVVVLAAIVTRQTRKFVTLHGKGSTRSIRRLGKWRGVALVYCLICLTFNFFLPMAMVVILSLVNSLSFAGSSVSFSWTLSNYPTAVNLPLFWPAFANSMTFSTISGLLAMFAGVFIAYTAIKSKVRGSRLIEHISSVPLAIPAIVYSFAVFLALLFLPGVSIFYGTIWPLVFASSFLRLPVTIRFITPNLVQISNELEESARVCGAGITLTFRRVMMPLLKGSLYSSFIFVFLDSFKDLGTVALLSTGTPGSVVLITLLLTLLTGQSKALWYIGAASIIIIVITTVVLVVLQRLNRNALADSRRTAI